MSLRPIFKHTILFRTSVGDALTIVYFVLALTTEYWHFLKKIARLNFVFDKRWSHFQKLQK
jgi:ABC-type phosphate transport system permease subunit